MLKRSLSFSFALALASAFLGGEEAQAQHGVRPYNVICRDYIQPRPDLFYNFYVPPNCGGVGVGIYPSPLPVPAHVGHTYYTYQPFMPHEFMYKHERSYHRYYNEGRGLTRTSVKWW